MKGFGFRNALKSLSSRFVYMIGDEGAILVYIEDGVVQRRLFAPTAELQHTRTFVDLMGEYPKAPINVLIDVLDQSYIRHSFPPVTSLGLGKIVERRLERDFAKDDIKGALLLNRESSGRKDWNFLLISLAYTKELQAWLDIVIDLPNRFAGLYLVPIEAEFLIQGLHQALHKPASVMVEEPRAASSEKPRRKGARAAKIPKAGKFKTKKIDVAAGAEQWKILVSHDKVGGYRQVVLKNDKLVFTRLTQASEGSAELQAGNVEQELQNTIEYLKRYGYNDQAPLDIYGIMAQEVKNSISTLRFGSPVLHVLTPYEAGELLGLKQAVLSGDRFGDMIVAASFGITRKHRLRFFPAYVVKLNKFYAARRFLHALVTLAMLGLIGYMLYDLAALPSLISTVNDQKNTQQKTQQQLAAFKDASGNLHVDADQVNDLMTIHGMLDAPGGDPLGLIRRLQPLFDPLHLLKIFDWKMPDPTAPALHLKEAPAAAATSASAAAAVPATTTSLTLDLVYSGSSWKEFVADSEVYFKKMQDAFPDYKFTHSDLPGQIGEEQSVTINYDEEAAREKAAAKGQDFDVNADLAGPSAVTPDAAKAGAALPAPPAARGGPP